VNWLEVELRISEEFPKAASQLKSSEIAKSSSQLFFSNLQILKPPTSEGPTNVLDARRTE